MSECSHLACDRRLVGDPQESDEDIHALRVEVRSRIGSELVERFIDPKRRTICARRGHGVEREAEVRKLDEMIERMG